MDNRRERESAANEIVTLSERIACYSESLFETANDRLQSVMRSDEIEPDEKEGVAQPVPPLFDVLRKNLWKIERSLNGISRCLNRTEL